MIKLTKKYIDSLKPQAKAYIIWDSDLKGFGLKVHKSGRKTYIIKYRNQYHQQRKPTIADCAKLTLDQARTQAKQLFAQVAQGHDPSEEKQTAKNALTMAELCDKFIHDYCTVRIKSSTMRDYKAHVMRYIKPHFGKMKVSAVQRSDIAKLHHQYQHTPYVANRTLKS